MLKTESGKSTVREDRAPITVWLPKAHYEWLLAVAATEDVSLSDIVRRLIRERRSEAAGGG